MDYRVVSVLAFLEALNARHFRSERWVWIFRGLSREEYQLIPTVGRISHTSSSREKFENILFEAFQREALPHLTSAPQNPWEWLAVAQHHGLPTRLIDWTYNPFVALYFAVEDQAEYNGVVVALRGIERVKLLATQDPFSISEPMLYVPASVTPRIVAQEGIFTVQPKVETPLSEQIKSKCKLDRFLIEVGAKEKIRYELFRLGFHRGSLFPDVNGISAHIKWRNTVKPPKSREKEGTEKKGVVVP